ncbi:hypothetical protein [Phocaeicola coprocola]|jgi:hypothetical protein|uniref:hypothetical protein n=1 Tax=Phocaeicola coprocola TaxID=310298 RepID=UPI003AF1A005|nr:hypothetical protein [Bacteroides sp.]
MKRNLFILIFLYIAIAISAQTNKSELHTKENDFMVAVLNNPTFSLYDFISIANLHERNTQFLKEELYRESDFIKNKCKELYGQYNIQTLHIIYKRVSTAWKVLLEVQNCDVSYNGMGKYFNIKTQLKCPYPELKYKLSIIPLTLL